MNDFLYSIITICFCTTVYYFSWQQSTKGNWALAICLLMLSGFALRMYTASDFFLHSWDERYHALTAKNLIQHPLTPTLYDNPILPYDYRNWTSNHIWVHKQPLPLWSIAASMWLFGINEIALRLPSILLTTIGIYLSFFIGNYFFNKKIAYLTAFLFSINGLIIELTAGRVATDHIDIFFLFFIELAIVFSILFAQQQKTTYTVLAGISMGAAILSKWLPAFIVVPIWLLIVLDAGKCKRKEVIIQLIILLTTCMLVFLPWQFYIYKVFPLEANWEAKFNFKHIFEVLSEQTGPVYYFVNKIRINYGELIYLPLAWFIWNSVKNPNDKKRMAILIWILVPMLFFSIAKTKMQGYILFIAPAIFLVTADFFYMLVDVRRGHKYKWLLNLLLFLLITLPVRYMIERVKPFTPNNRNPAWAVDLRKLNDKNISKGVLFNYSKPIEAMFYTNLMAYQEIPNKQTIIGLINEGYVVIIQDDGKLPKEIKDINGIRFERLRND